MISFLLLIEILIILFGLTAIGILKLRGFDFSLKRKVYVIHPLKSTIKICKAKIDEHGLIKCKHYSWNLTNDKDKLKNIKIYKGKPCFVFLDEDSLINVHKDIDEVFELAESDLIKNLTTIKLSKNEILIY